MAKDDFPAVSYGPPRPAEPGAVWDETLHELDEGKDWKKEEERGDQIGSVRLEHSRGEDGIEVTASFSFNEGRDVTYRGPVPGRGSWKGTSTLDYVRGDKRGRDKLNVDSTNPKRWG